MSTAAIKRGRRITVKVVMAICFAFSHSLSPMMSLTIVGKAPIRSSSASLTGTGNLGGTAQDYLSIVHVHLKFEKTYVQTLHVLNRTSN